MMGIAGTLADTLESPLIGPFSGDTQGKESPLTRKARRIKAKFVNHLAENTVCTYLELSIFFGVIASLVAIAYRVFFEILLALVWNSAKAGHGHTETDSWFEKFLETIPSLRAYAAEPLFEHTIRLFPALISTERISFLYIIFTTTLFGVLAGAVHKFIGYPGDLPDTVRNLHENGGVPIKQSPSMFLCSAFSLVSGCSIGPEATLLALCGSISSWISVNIFELNIRAVRHCTLMSMAAGLTSFFGVPVGGCIFVFELMHRTGLQFYEALMYAMSSSMVSLIMFNSILSIPFEPIWPFPQISHRVSNLHMAIGLILGLLSSVISILLVYTHKYVKMSISSIGLNDRKKPILTAGFGGFLLAIIGIVFPHTMFWGEAELSTVARSTLALPHLWPAGGLWGFHLFDNGNYPAYYWILICFFKCLTVSLSLATGFRGGIIFPLMFAGAAFGQGLYLFMGDILGIDSIVFTMSCAGALNTAITRTPLSSCIILTCLSGDVEVLLPVTISCMVAFYITLPFKFVTTQRDRDDMVLAEDSFEGRRNDVILAEDSFEKHVDQENFEVVLDTKISLYETVTEEPEIDEIRVDVALLNLESSCSSSGPGSHRSQ